VDPDLRLTSLQGAGLAALGLRPNQTVGLTLYEYYQTDDPEHPHIQLHHRALAGESVISDGEFQGRHYHTRLEPLRKEGDIIGAIGLAHDITERRRAEEMIKEYARRLLDVQEQERRHLARELH